MNEPGHPEPNLVSRGARDEWLYRRTFIGRDDELAQLNKALHAAEDRNDSLLTVVGEPGIGKTAFCEQLATHASARAFTVLNGRCYEETSLPYLPFVEALRAHLLQLSDEDLRVARGAHAPEVARIVP
jgi:predicted ATPase